MVEYGLLVALIAVVSLVAAGGVGQATENQFDVIAASLGSDGDKDEAVEEQPEGEEDGTPTADPDAGPDDEDEEGPADPTGGDEDEADPTGGDEDEDDPASGDDDESEPAEEPVVPGSTVADTGFSGSYYWWNDTKHGGEGAWIASVSYHNEWIRHQYLTLEVTRVDERGNRATTTVNGFYVPAGGSSTYESWDNSLKLHKGDLTGVLSIEVKVVAIQTSDENWSTVSHTTEGPSTIIGAPQTP